MKIQKLFLCGILSLALLLGGCATQPAGTGTGDGGDGPSVTPDTPGTPDKPDTPDTPDEPSIPEGVCTSSDYVKKYADTASQEAWLNAHILNAQTPPVTFKAGGKSSSSLTWKKTVGDVRREVDFPEEEAPSERKIREIDYVCESEKIEIKLTLTTYTDYPVIEYDAVLCNLADGNSANITEMLSMDAAVETKEGAHFLHANRGSTCNFTDFEPLTYELNEPCTFEVDNGKPTSIYMPYFNVENKIQNTGTIAILNWQGSWKADFEKTDTGVTMRAGQRAVDVVLQKGETMRYPGSVLLFYKGDYMNGQNVYRRWLYSCNLFRNQGKHMKETNVLVCSAQNTQETDLNELALYESTGLTEYIDKYNEDAGWYKEKRAGVWTDTGNWFVDDTAYPDGLRAISDAAHDKGLQFAVWFEPERVVLGTKTTDDLEYENLLTKDSSGEVLLDYSDPAVVEYVLDTVTRVIKENKIDQYRQDFNTFPAPYWTARDNADSLSLDLPRTGYTENHYTTGYLSLYEGLLEKNPGMYIDSCASGGMRYDLETVRYSFMHTRSDNWADIESAQGQTYGSSMWCMYWGTGFSSADYNSYDVRSHIGNSIGVGISQASQAPGLIKALQEWEHLAGYLFRDYYPIGEYASRSTRTTGLQYDSPEEGKGMFISYFRKQDTFLAQPRGLDPAANYEVWNFDRPSEVRTMTGAELMAGIQISAPASSAIVYEYRLAEGSSTEDFQKAEVLTGPGSTDYVPEEEQTDLVKVEVPTLTNTYKAGFTDAELEALYNITGDNQTAYIGTDASSTGVIYAISKNMYDEFIYAGNTYNGWQDIDKTKIYLHLGTDQYPLSTWNGTIFTNLTPYAKKIGDTYFLWLACFVPFGDPDGGWQNGTNKISWDKKGGGSGIADWDTHVAGSELNRIQYVGVSSFEADGSIYSIDEQIFSSFRYTGKGFVNGEETWMQIDPASIGFASCWWKLPPPNADLASYTVMVSRMLDEKADVFARTDGTHYYLWIRSAFNIEVAGSGAKNPRAILVWRDTDGNTCTQSMLFPVNA